MKTNYIYRVLKQFSAHSYASPVKEKVQRWLIDDTWTAEKNNALHTIWNQIQTAPNESTGRSFRKVNHKIKRIENKGMRINPPPTWLRYAAVVVLVFSIGGGYFFLNREVEMVKVFTANKERKKCILPDGTTVVLNAGSQLAYPSRFEAKARDVCLEGEAFFIVVRDTARPFSVQTSALSVKVLGTEFNISAYPAHESTTATLSSGSIQIFLKTGKRDAGYILEPDQEFVYNKTDQSVRIYKSSDEVASWKEGRLIFQDVALHDILDTLERRFDVTILYDKRKLSNRSYMVKFRPHESLENILNVLQDLAGDFVYRIEGSRVTLYVP